MIESHHVLSQTGQTVPRRLIGFVEVTQQPVIIRGVGLEPGEEYGIEYSFSGVDKWIPFSPNGAQKKITTLNNPAVVATPGKYRVVPLTAVNNCARFDTITGTTSHEWLLEYIEPTIITNNISGGGGSVTFASRAQTRFGTDLDLVVNPDTIAQAIQHRGYIYGSGTGDASSIVATMTPPLSSYDNTSVLVISLNLDSSDSAVNAVIEIDGLGAVPIRAQNGGPLFISEIPRLYDVMLIWRGSYFVLLNPADSQGIYSVFINNDPGITVISALGHFSRIADLSSELLLEPGRQLSLHGSVSFQSVNSSNAVSLIIPFPSNPLNVTAVGSVHLSVPINGQITALIFPGSGTIVFRLNTGTVSRELLYSDLPPGPTVTELLFSINYLSHIVV